MALSVQAEGKFPRCGGFSLDFSSVGGAQPARGVAGYEPTSGASKEAKANKVICFWIWNNSVWNGEQAGWVGQEQ